MFNVDGNAGQHREMTREALDIILKLWTAEEPFDYPGKYWHVTKTDRMLESLIPHIKPFEKPYPPIGVAGVSAGSETLKLAGEHGFLPMSLNLNQTYVASHWASVEEGGRRTGRGSTDVEGLRGRPRAQSRGFARPGPTGSVSGTTEPAGLYP